MNLTRFARLEFRMASADGALRWVLATTVLLIVFGAWNGVRWRDFRVRAVDAIHADAEALGRTWLLDYDRHVAGELDESFEDPATPYFVYAFFPWHAIAPPAPLSTLSVAQTDLHAYYAVGNMVSPNLLYHHEEIQNPAVLASGRFDLAFFLVIVLPVLIIGLSFDLAAADRRSGRDRMLALHAGREGRVVALRAILRYCWLAGATLLPLGAALVATGGAADPASREALAFLLLLTGAYLAFWFGLAWLVNTRGASPARNAVLLLAAWGGLALVAPGIVDGAARAAHPLDAGSLGPAEERRILQTIDDSAAIARLATYEQLQLDRSSDVARESGWVAGIELRRDTTAALLAQRRAVVLSRQRVADRLAVLSPPLLLHRTIQAAAGTSTQHALEFEARTAAAVRERAAVSRRNVLEGRPADREQIVLLAQSAVLDLAQERYRAEWSALMWMLILAAIPPAAGALLRAGRDHHAALVTAAAMLIIACMHPAAARAQAASDPRNFTTVVRSLEAARAETVVRIDGRLDDEAWQNAQVADGFVQIEPTTGAPARHQTVVRVLYDDLYLYVAGFLRDADGAGGVRSGLLRRDFDTASSDVFTIMLDPFGDSRNVLVFQVNPWGAVRDLQVRDGRTANEGWDAVWQARTVVSDSGWTAEVAIPWRTLRYPRDNATSLWAVNFARVMRRDNEISAWSAWPRGQASFQMEYAGSLAGIEPPPPARNIRLQPYTLVSDERVGDRALRQGSDRIKVGGDVKWAITPGTVLDLTVNTDFAQTDVDEQVVNLNRYSPFFPEKRAFFLESAGTFDVGYNQFTPFYSRSIGLENGVPVPLDGGIRLTSATGAGQLGALVVRQRGGAGRDPVHFGVGRVSRNFGAGRSRLGALAVLRHDDAPDSSTFNAVVAVDGFARLGGSGAITAFVSGSRTTDADAGLASYLWIRTNPTWGYIGFLQDIATASYRADAGFIFRRDVMLNSPAGNIDLRPSWLPRSVRRLNPGFSSFVYHRLSDREFLQADLRLSPLVIELHGGSSVRITGGRTWQRLDAAEAAAFRPLGATMAPGDYGYNIWILSASSNPSRRLATSGQITSGGYYDGALTSAQGTLHATPSPHISVRLGYQLNAARDLGVGAVDVDAHQTTAELRLAPSPRLQLSGLHQWSSLSDRSAFNLRLSWEFRPLSYMHVVYNDSRLLLDAAEREQLGPAGDPARQLMLKLSYLLPL